MNCLNLFYYFLVGESISYINYNYKVIFKNSEITYI